MSQPTNLETTLAQFLSNMETRDRLAQEAAKAYHAAVKELDYKTSLLFKDVPGLEEEYNSYARHAGLPEKDIPHPRVQVSDGIGEWYRFESDRYYEATDKAAKTLYYDVVDKLESLYPSTFVTTLNGMNVEVSWDSDAECIAITKL